MLKLPTLTRPQGIVAIALSVTLLTIAILTEATTLLLLSVVALLLTIAALMIRKRGNPPAQEKHKDEENQVSNSTLEDNIHADSSDITVPDEPAAAEREEATASEELSPTDPPIDDAPAEQQPIDETEKVESEHQQEREPTEATRDLEEPQETHEWLPSRDRADALLQVSRIYQQFQDSVVPLSVLIGEATSKELSQLSGEGLDLAITCKEAVDQTASSFGLEEPQQLFDQLLYCSMSHERSIRIGELLKSTAPQLVQCMETQDQDERSACLKQLFEQLVSLGEFLPSERGEATALWEQEFEPEIKEEASEAEEEEKVFQALEQIEQSQTDSEPIHSAEEKPQTKPRKSGSKDRARNKRVEHARKLTQRHGIHLEQLIGKEESEQESSEQLLNLILSARGETGEEYSDHVDGTAADLMVESILRIKLQNRICQLYREHQHLPSYEATEEKIMESLNWEFGTVVVNNHRSSIRHHLEWATGTNSPCNNNILNRSS